jgi:hypothetical protein
MLMTTLAAEIPADIGQTVADIATTKAAAPAGEIGRYRYLLLMRFGVVNLTGFALVGGAWMEGWIDPIIATDDTRLCLLIGAVFLLGLALAGEKALMLSHELNELDRGPTGAKSKIASYMTAIAGRDGQVRANLMGALKLKLAHRIAGVRHVASSLVLLGLIGTVVGFIISLSGVNPDTVADATAIGPMVSKLLEGMGVALYTTLVGSVLNIWLMLNHRLLEGGAIHLLSHLVEEAERHAGA